jgi:hypothetical protein
MLGPPGKPVLWLRQSADKPAPLHLAFTAADRQQVEAFYGAVVAA